jgi:hypothetical protein
MLFIWKAIVLTLLPNPLTQRGPRRIGGAARHAPTPETRVVEVLPLSQEGQTQLTLLEALPPEVDRLSEDLNLKVDAPAAIGGK